MRIKKFNNFSINESTDVACKASTLTGEVTLYRLTSHPVVDLSQPGEYYVCSVEDVDPNLLEKKDGELYLITVKTNSDNINLDESEKECAKLGTDSVVAVKDDTKCEVVGVSPFTKK